MLGSLLVGTGEYACYLMIILLLFGIVILCIVVLFGLGVPYVSTPIRSTRVTTPSSIVSSLRSSGAVPSLLGAITTEVTFVSAMITDDCPYVKSVASSSSSRVW